MDRLTIFETLRSGPITAELEKLGGVTAPVVVQVAGHLNAVLKTKHRNHNPILEVVAYDISEYLGFNLVPCTVLRDDIGFASLQLYVESVPIKFRYALVDSVIKNRGNRHVPAIVENCDSAELQKQAVFDFVIGNSDRSINKNWLLTSEKKVVSIDHGLAFDECNTKLRFQANVHLFEEFLMDETRRPLFQRIANATQDEKFRQLLINRLSDKQTKHLIHRMQVIVRLFDAYTLMVNRPLS